GEAPNPVVAVAASIPRPPTASHLTGVSRSSVAPRSSSSTTPFAPGGPKKMPRSTSSPSQPPHLAVDPLVRAIPNPSRVRLRPS
uniref:Uncharacterized protein n=1 Tax=Triticum urartu TaxID=4572 RepID=A0A8R7QEZ3_TRIUA